MNICDANKCTVCCGCINICAKDANQVIADETEKSVAYLKENI